MKKTKSIIATGVGGVFVLAVNAEAAKYPDGNLHLPPGNAPITIALSTANTTTLSVISTLGWAEPFNATIDSDYVAPVDAKVLKRDGQTQKA